MRTLTVQEASKGLGGWLRRAAQGEQIAINEGTCIVMLHPLFHTSATPETPPQPREALRRLQANPILASEEADRYLIEVREERLADGGEHSR